MSLKLLHCNIWSLHNSVPHTGWPHAQRPAFTSSIVPPATYAPESSRSASSNTTQRAHSGRPGQGKEQEEASRVSRAGGVACAAAARQLCGLRLCSVHVCAA